MTFFKFILYLLLLVHGFNGYIDLIGNGPLAQTNQNKKQKNDKAEGFGEREVREGLEIVYYTPY